MFIQLSSCLSDPKQVVKLLILIVFLCITVNQLSECANKLLHPSVSTSYKLHLNKTVKYPSLTICRRPAYKTFLFGKYGITVSKGDYLYLDNAFSKFNFDNYTIEDFLSETTYDVKEALSLYGFAGFIGINSELDIKSSFYIARGRCHLVTPKVAPSSFSEAGGYFFKLSFSDEMGSKVSMDGYGVSVTGYDIYLHDPSETITDDSDQSNSFMEYLGLEPGQMLKVVINVATFKQVSTESDPCISNATYSKSRCEEECIHNQIAEKVGCTLPWLRTKKKFPQCDNYYLVKTLVSGFNVMNKTNFLKNCNCNKIRCHISMYETNVETKTDISTLKYSAIGLYYKTNLIKHVEEIIGYDWNNFVSDIGGSLGFLLGLSAIGLIEIAEELIELILRRKRKKQKLLAEKKEASQHDEVKESNSEIETDVIEIVNHLSNTTNNLNTNKIQKSNNINEQYMITSEKY